MAGKNRIFLDNEYFYKLDKSYTNVNGIWLYPIEFMAVHNGTELGLQEISLQGVVYEEIIFSDLDLFTSIGKYTVDPITNSIIIIVDKTPIDSDVEATNYIRGLLLNYEMKSLEYFSTDSLYTMETYASDGTFIGSTQASSTSVLMSKMFVLDSSQDVNSSTGYYYHNLRRALQVPS